MVIATLFDLVVASSTLAAILTHSVLVTLRLLVSFGDGHVHVGGFVIILSAIVAVIVRVAAAILLILLEVSLPCSLGTVILDGPADAIEALLSHVNLRLALASVTAHVHAVALTFLGAGLVDVGSGWWLITTILPR